MPRPRSVKHCRECSHYYYTQIPFRAHYCARNSVRIPWGWSRTSPMWCPEQHFIPGRYYPLFQAGEPDKLIEEERRELPAQQEERPYAWGERGYP